MKNEIILFTDGDINIEVQINPEQETVWLTQKQMEELFDVKHATISEHITNILMVVGGLMYIAFPLLIVGGIIALVMSHS